MRRTMWTSLGIIILLSAGSACNRGTEAAEDNSAASTAPVDAAAASASQPSKTKTACALLPSSEVDSILGTTTRSEAEEGVGKTACTYTAAGRSMPFVKVEIEWDNGRVAMMASGMLGRLEPGIASAVNELGDAAAQIGPALWIRVGEHLVTLTFFGVDDTVTAAKRMMAILRPQL